MFQMSLEQIRSSLKFWNQSKKRYVPHFEVSKYYCELHNRNKCFIFLLLIIFILFVVQYSPREDFSIIIAEKTISEWNIFQGTMGVNFLLDSLVQRRRYYFRASSGNLKGYGTYKVSNPVSVVPSSWKDMEENPRDATFLTQRDTLDNIYKQVQQHRTEEPLCDEQR